MKIVNPLYDNVFKYMMQENRIAKKVLSVFLECEILELTIEQQEIIAVDEVRGLRLYRLDFSAVILNEFGKRQKVLIELQKSKLPSNYLRFRTYLGESYIKKEIVTDENGNEETKVYPIISIYILGYNVVDIPYLAVSIDNKITNTVTKEEIQVNSDFINLLTHKTKIIQVRRLSENRRTRLERFLTLFNQSWITSEKYILDLQEIPQEFNDIINHLQAPVNNVAFRNKLKAEDEIDEIFRKQEAELEEARQIAEIERRQKEEAIKREEEAEKRKEEAIKREEEAIQQKQEAEKKAEFERQQKQEMQLNIAENLLKQGMSVSTVAAITQLSEAVINQINIET